MVHLFKQQTFSRLLGVKHRHFFRWEMMKYQVYNKNSNNIINTSQVAQVVKNPPANPGDAGEVASVSRLGRSPGEGNGNPLHYSHLGNPMDRGAWWATLHGVARSQTWLSDGAHMHYYEHFYVLAKSSEFHLGKNGKIQWS